MSRSGPGTYSTKSFINQDSSRYVDRDDSFMAKHGSRSSGTDAAHKLSWGLVNAINTHTAGRPLGDSGRVALAMSMGSADNLRLKSDYGNRTLDERRDARIASAFVNDTPISSHTAAQRASIAYQAAAGMGGHMSHVASSLGDMRVYDPSTGRTHALRNHDAHLARHGR